MANELDFLLRFVEMSLVIGVIEVLLERCLKSRQWQSNGVQEVSPKKSPLNVGGGHVFIGKFLGWNC